MGITSSTNAYPVKENASLSLVGLSGLEPPTSRLSGVRSNRLSYKPEENFLHDHLITICMIFSLIYLFLFCECFIRKWRLRDSNSRPPACKAGALPTELSPHRKTSGFPQENLIHDSRQDNSVRNFLIIQQPPALPYRLQYSTIGRLRLNHRVRDENGCVP